MDDETKQLLDKFQSTIKELNDVVMDLGTKFYEDLKGQVAQLSKKDENQK